MNRQRLRERAEAVLHTNDRGAHTVPSPRLYPHQWAWDSAFIAIGWAQIDPMRGFAELESLFSAQWPDGRIPHILFDPDSGDYFPGPDFWGTEGTSTISQPPVFAMALRRLVDAGLDSPKLPAMIRAIDRAHLFFHEQRDPLGLNLVAVAHPWESGLDNSPSWDAPLENVEPSKIASVKRKSSEIIADPTQRPGDDEYRRYMRIVEEIAENGFGLGSFAVYDPMMTALLAVNETELARLAAEHGFQTEAARRSEQLQSALVEHLWNEEAGRFDFLDAHTEQRLSLDILAAYLPMILDLPGEMLERMSENLRERYWTTYPLPTVPPGSPLFEPRRYWRGPVWINMNWLLAPRFGSDLVEKTLEVVDVGDFHEYFQTDTGEGLGGESFAWSAALTLDLLARY